MDESRKEIIIESVETTTPHNKALYESGKSILIDSINTGREFCKFMITVSTSAIPIHLGLLKFVLPKDYILSFQNGLIAIIPSILFLIAAIVFTIGYYPQIGLFSLDIIQEIENERTKTIKRRKVTTLWGFTIFIIATLSMILCITIFLTMINQNVIKLNP
jgi:hypothetical protein